MDLKSVCLLITSVISGLSGYKIDETYSHPSASENQPSSRNSKILFVTDNSREISELR